MTFLLWIILAVISQRPVVPFLYFCLGHCLFVCVLRIVYRVQQFALLAAAMAPSTSVLPDRGKVPNTMPVPGATLSRTSAVVSSAPSTKFRTSMMDEVTLR